MEMGAANFLNVRMGAGGWEHGDGIKEMGAWGWNYGDGSMGLGAWGNFLGCLLSRNIFLIK